MAKFKLSPAVPERPYTSKVDYGHFVQQKMGWGDLMDLSLKTGTSKRYTVSDDVVHRELTN